MTKSPAVKGDERRSSSRGAEEPGGRLHAVAVRVQVRAWVTAGTGDGFTSTATNPYQRIDGVFVDRRLTITKVEVIGTPDVLIASDHRPNYVEIEL